MPAGGRTESGTRGQTNKGGDNQSQATLAWPRELTLGRDGLGLARADGDRAGLGQVGSRPPHFDLHMSVALIYVIL